MRRNIYIRLLLSIVGITVLVMAIQVVMLLVSTRIAERTWKERVFDDYAQTLSTTFQDAGRISFADLLYILVDSASDRVAGLLVRDDVGKISISIGSSSRGGLIPQPYGGGGRLLDSYNSSSMAIPSSFTISVSTTEDYINEEIRVPEYRIDLSTRPIAGNVIVEDIRVSETGLEGTEAVSLPSVITRDDIAGSIVLYNNGTVYGYIDIIVFDIDVYGPTEMLLKDFAGKFLIFLPIAVLISLLAGYFISKRNANMIREIRRALRELSIGNYDVSIDKKLVNYDDFSVIADSIEHLGIALERHRKSRKEWLRNISHDLNTPVTSMNILLSGAEDGVFPVNNDLIKAVKKENDILSERIASVAYYSNLLYEDSTVNLVETDIFDVISSALEHRSGYKIEGDYGNVFVKVDFELIKRALKEVLDNAEEYGEKGNDIIIEVKKNSDEVILTVTNRGKLPEPRPPFFEPWARGDDSRHEGGSGLGLPIVHQIMEMHHGSVLIDEKDGCVSVRLRFPV